MVLSAVFISIFILVLIGMKGPLELIILKSAGLNLVESFEATLKTDSLSSWFKGGTLLMILVVQPLVFGILSLRIIDKVHSLFVLAKLQAYNFLQLEQYGASVPKTKDDLMAMVSSERPYLPVASTFKNMAAASIDDITNLMTLKNLSLDFSIFMVLFRGSKSHIIITIMAFTGYIGSLFILPIKWVGIGAAITLAVIIGPTLFLYSCSIVDFCLSTLFVKRELRMLQSKYYEAYKQTLWESKKPIMPFLTRCLLKATAALLYLKCWLYSGIEVYSNREKLSAYLKILELTAKDIERLRLPGVSRRLMYLAQWRDNQFSFRCNPACDQVLRNNRILRCLANSTLII